MDKDQEVMKEQGDGTEEQVKPVVESVESEEPKAPVGDEPLETEDSSSEDDIADTIDILNQFQQIIGGKGQITGLPKNLIPVIKFTIEKMVALRDLFKDPYYKQLIDEMIDQKEDGKTPSVLAAIAKVIPIDEIEELADSEDYESAHKGVESRLASEKEASDNESQMYAMFQESQNAGKSYCQKKKYDEAEMKELFSFALGWFKILGDGQISEKEWEQIDKLKNYDSDMESIKKQIPSAPVKEVLPDKSSMEESMMPRTEKPKASPSTMIESLGVTMSEAPDFSRMGRMKRNQNRINNQ